MLNIDANGFDDLGIYNAYFSLSNLRYGLVRKRPRMKFVHRVFFRKDHNQLHLCLADPELTDLEREESEIPDEVIATNGEMPLHRFWPSKAPKAGKRKTDESMGESGTSCYDDEAGNGNGNGEKKHPRKKMKNN